MLTDGAIGTALDSIVANDRITELERVSLTFSNAKSKDVTGSYRLLDPQAP